MTYDGFFHQFLIDFVGKSAFLSFPVFIYLFDFQDLEVALKGQFDAVLDTIGVPETERLGINLLKRGGHYMTLQVRDGCFVYMFPLTRNVLLAL